MKKGIRMSSSEIPLVPEGGFPIEAFPVVMALSTTYTTCAGPHPEPMLTINHQNQLMVDVSTIRLVLPSREEWRKLVWMVEALWNSHELANEQELLSPQQFIDVLPEENTHVDDAADQPGAQHRGNSSHPG